MGLPSCVLLPQVSICLECNSSKLRGLKRKWIRCSAQATVLHLKKFIAKKLNLSSFNEVIVKPQIETITNQFSFVKAILLRFFMGGLLGDLKSENRKLSLFYVPPDSVTGVMGMTRVEGRPG